MFIHQDGVIKVLDRTQYTFHITDADTSKDLGLSEQEEVTAEQADVLKIR